MDENNTFFFWEEISKVSRGEQTHEEFLNKFYRTASQAIAGDILKEIDRFILEQNTEGD